MLQNRVLSKMFEIKKDEKTGDWKNLLNDELHNTLSSANIMQVTKLRRVRCLGHVERTEERCMQSFGGEPWGKEIAWKT